MGIGYEERDSLQQSSLYLQQLVMRGGAHLENPQSLAISRGSLAQSTYLQQLVMRGGAHLQQSSTISSNY